VPGWRNVAGFVRGPWGITREEWGSWNLTHTPTGACVGGFRQRRWAESFAAALDRLPIDWTALRIKTVADAVAPFKQELKALMAQRRSFRPPQPTGRAAAYSRRAGRSRKEKTP
jgi:hypothetical protein